MKAYDYEWSKPAEALLGKIWLNATDRNAVSTADYQAEKLLQQSPRTAGWEMSEGLWQIIVPPLKIYYEIDDLKRLVTVTHVRVINPNLWKK